MIIFFPLNYQKYGTRNPDFQVSSQVPANISRQFAWNKSRAFSMTFSGTRENFFYYGSVWWLGKDMPTFMFFLRVGWHRAIRTAGSQSKIFEFKFDFTISQMQESNLGQLGEKRECFLCAMPSPQDMPTYHNQWSDFLVMLSKPSQSSQIFFNPHSCRRDPNVARH